VILVTVASTSLFIVAPWDRDLDRIWSPNLYCHEACLIVLKKNIDSFTLVIRPIDAYNSLLHSPTLGLLTRTTDLFNCFTGMMELLKKKYITVFVVNTNGIFKLTFCFNLSRADQFRTFHLDLPACSTI